MIRVAETSGVIHLDQHKGNKLNRVIKSGMKKIHTWQGEKLSHKYHVDRHVHVIL